MSDTSKTKTVVIMVGLPARGKTFLSLKLKRYLEWQGLLTSIFNVGGYRRELLGMESSRSDFFNPRITGYAMERERIAKRCFSDLSAWLKEAGDVAVYDATSVTAARREYLKKECLANGFDFIFVENICDDPEILDTIVGVKISNSVDYMGKDDELARRDFGERLNHYESVYATVGTDLPYIKIFNFGERVSRNFGPGRPLFDDISEFLGSVNLAEKEIYLTRHGETFFNLEDRIGGDSSLTDRGVEYARRLSGFFKGRELAVFTSGKRRTIETAEFLGCGKARLPELNEINSGICDGMTYGEIAAEYPEIDGSRKADKFGFRYPGGESYGDLIQRVKKAVCLIEAQRKDVLVIAHRAVNRCLFSYFIPTPPADIPYIDMPLDTIVRIRPEKALYGYEVVRV